MRTSGIDRELHNVVRQEVVSPLRRKVFNYIIDDSERYQLYDVDSPHTNNSRVISVETEIMQRFLQTKLGEYLWKSGVALNCESCKDHARFSTHYMIMANFTNEQFHEYEKWEFMNKLSGDIN